MFFLNALGGKVENKLFLNNQNIFIHICLKIKKIPGANFNFKLKAPTLLI